ncbi:MAG: IS110 family transposase [Saprospiraceae bacterium]|nr:IS110 family transposase [Saprospiraceae bacterium]
MTIVSIISETNGFALIENAKQLASYAGLDVVYNESGLKKHKPHNIKKGNKHLQKSCLSCSHLSAYKYNPKLKDLYLRLVAKKEKKKLL